MTPRRQKVNKMHATLVAVCLALGLLPLVTQPAKAYTGDVFVFDNNNAYSENSSSGTPISVPGLTISGATVTLNNVNITGALYFQSTSNKTTITLIGDNVINGIFRQASTTVSTLTINGSGSLTVTRSSGIAMQINRNLVINGCFVKAAGSTYGLQVGGTDGTNGSLTIATTSGTRVWLEGGTAAGNKTVPTISTELAWRVGNDNLGDWMIVTSQGFDVQNVKKIDVVIPARYTLTLNSNGGTSNGSATASLGQTALTSVTHATRTGYTRTGYFTAASGGTKILNAGGTYAGNVEGWIENSKWAMVGSRTLYAQWAVSTNTITLDANGGTSVTESITATYGQQLPSSVSIPSRTGWQRWQFGGYWTEASGGTQFYDGNGDRVWDENWTQTSDMTLYAKWLATRNVIIEDNTSASFTVSENGASELFEHFDIDSEDMITLTLTVEETNDETAEGAEEILVEVKGRMLQFFNITFEKNINGNIEKLTELPVPIQVVIDLSPELSGKPGYSVYRYHDNAAELLGMNNTDGEYYTVSRGTEDGGVDQIVIYTKKFSTYAVVEHIVSLGGSTLESFEEDSDEFEVQARIIDGTPAVYHIDIEWGNMKFEYYPDAFAGIWNTETSTYEGAKEQGWHGMDGENNKITVTNRSNADVTVNIKVTENLFEKLPDAEVEMEVYTTNDFDEESSEEQDKRHLGKVPAQGAQALSIDAFLWIDGVPEEPVTAEHDPEIWHRVGTITVTITSDGDSSLTPR